MPSLPRLLHGAIDGAAMWTEDLRARAAQPFRSAPAAPLDCFGPVAPAPVPSPPAAAVTWRIPSPRPEGDAVTLHAWPPEGPGRGTAVLVPPWKIPSAAVVAGYVRLLRRAGLEVWVPVPPHHLDRAVPGVRSGEGFVTLDLPALRRTLEQAVLEIRALLAAAAARAGEVGLVGLSLGALAAALAATGPERLDFAALVAPPADLGHVVARTRIGRRYRALALRAGAPLPERRLLRRMLAPFRAAARPPTAGRVLVALGRYDRIVPPAGPAVLARAWRISPRAYPRGHLTLLFACRALRRDLARFVAATSSPPPGTRPARG
jgi:hypothetical protein